MYILQALLNLLASYNVGTVHGLSFVVKLTIAAFLLFSLLFRLEISDTLNANRHDMTVNI